MQIIESDERKSSGEVPPEDMNGRARVLGRTNDVHHWGVEREGRGDVDLNQDQGVVMDSGTPLKIVECTNQERGSSKACV